MWYGKQGVYGQDQGKRNHMIAQKTMDSLAFAQQMDAHDPLKDFREKFHLPLQEDHTPFIYLCGNSLGLQPRSTEAHISRELKDWQNLGVEGHLHAHNPWLPYHEFLTEAIARVVGAQPEEVVVMNTLTVNLHLMLVSFYRPTSRRRKILIEADAFPSDKYAVASQIRFHGFDPERDLIELKARANEYCLREEDIKATIDAEGDEIALILFGNTNYYTGQYFDMAKITAWGHEKGCLVGFDCAHGAGNVPLKLSESGCDFAVWCNYKYLNAGPGGMGGTFINKRHHHNQSLPRFEGWWGHNKDTRFNMRQDFDALPTSEAWQLSNPPIMALSAVWAALKLHDEAGIESLRAKSIKLTGYLEALVTSLGSETIEIITPTEPESRGAQLSIRVKNAQKNLFKKITELGVIADWREPDVIRVAPAPMYNSFEDVYRFYAILKEAI